MAEILKPIFEWLVGHFQLFENPLYDSFVMMIMGGFSYVVAFRFVGKLYDEEFIDGRIMGSIIHWVVRLIVFTVLFVLGSIAIRLYNLEWAWWIWLLIAAFITFAIQLVVFVITAYKGILADKEASI
jgi:hypothetical protein